ncbi:hypothetical protein [Bacillus phage BC-T25]|nr:hypothetical protein [Bacillus phage BC-T25]
MEQEVTYEMQKNMSMTMLREVYQTLEKEVITPIDLRAITCTLMNVVELVYDPLIQQEKAEKFAEKVIEHLDKEDPYWNN